VLPVPTARFVVAMAAMSVVVVLARIGSATGLVALDGAVLLLGAFDWFVGVRPQSVAIERELPRRVTLGSEGIVAWRVHNAARRRVRLRFSDELAPSLGARARRVRMSVPAGTTRGASTTIRPCRRGRFEPGEVVVRIEGPLGLVCRQARRRVEGSLQVHPAFASVKEAELAINRAHVLEAGARVVRGRGGGTELESLRDYQVDDEVRRIDWAATARAGKAIVREQRPERNQTVLVLLDAGRVMAGQVAGVPRLEHAMDAVLMLGHVATRLGDRVGLVTFDREVRSMVSPSHAPSQLSRMSDAMFDLDPALVESDYRGAFARTLARHRRRALLVLLTELAEEAVPETLLPALPLLVRRHVVVVASVADPEVAAWADASPADVTGAYRSAAAETALLRRSDTTARLRAAGTTVVDAPPGALGTRLTDAYLGVKALGQL